ncbi:putative calcium-transporting ATPase 13, plasma membrane-type [Pistacia vera]|uniref:putative calcium-transporting ATPase 13, plasma membrane-type n=1 Tax=Pistacia vera TaxID=55513 RepID=UPI00126391D2|nr:putative calcium-transporting ATPase 13, plasma membrane-type [Pistacia vera]
MDTLGALALATERPTNQLMIKPPVGRTEPLITNVMWRNLTAQALYQIFNEFNARNLEKKNIFKGLHKNKLFVGIVGATLILQVLMVEFLNRFANTKRLNWVQWGACVGIASMSWLIGWLVKWITVSGKQFLFFFRRGAPAT